MSCWTYIFILIKAIRSDYLSAESYSFLNNTYTDTSFIKIIAYSSLSFVAKQAERRIIIIIFNGKIGHKGPQLPHIGNRSQKSCNGSKIMYDSELGVGIASTWIISKRLA